MFLAHIKTEHGLTLIEIMVVLIILGGLLVLGLPRIGSHDNELKATVRKLSVLGKQLHVHARLQNRTFRLAFHLPDRKPHSFWVESADGYISEDPNPEEEEDESQENEEEGRQSLSAFQTDTTILKKPITLPASLSFKDIEVEDQVIREGKAYVHFFPQGIIEEVAIHISNKKNANWTVVYHSLTGKGHIINQEISLRDLRRN